MCRNKSLLLPHHFTLEVQLGEIIPVRYPEKVVRAGMYVAILHNPLHSCRRMMLL